MVSRRRRVAILARLAACSVLTVPVRSFAELIVAGMRDNRPIACAVRGKMELRIFVTILSVVAAVGQSRCHLSFYYLRWK